MKYSICGSWEFTEQWSEDFLDFRLPAQQDGTIRVSRLTYEATSEAAEAYARRAEKADPEIPSRPRRRRRRRSGSAAKAAETKTE